MNIGNYTVFDVETASSRRDSICSIGIVSVKDHSVVFSDEFLVNPECEFSAFNVGIHGITAEKVEDAPIFPVIWEQISNLFTDTVLVAHNAKSMDLCALCRTLDKYGLPIPEINYVCTYELAKEIISTDTCISYKLTDLCEYYNIDCHSHHNALNDTRACKALFECFCRMYPNYISPKPYNYQHLDSDCSCRSNTTSLYSEKTIAMQEFERIAKAAIKDNAVTIQEATELYVWMNNHQGLKGCYKFDEIFFILDTILNDSQIDNSEKTALLEALIDFIYPKTTKSPIDINGKFICLSGDFVFGTKKEVEEHLVKNGAVVIPAPTKKMDILILGGEGSSSWKHENYGAKYEKVIKYNEKGATIAIYKEEDILGE